MHYYQFNIGDYKAHTEHLEPMEDLAFRRMMDWCYLHEKPLPLDIKEIERLIRMRTHSESIAYVLETYFERTAKGYANSRIMHEIEKYQEKSEKAKKSAQARWNKKASKQKGLDDANALQAESESNAKHKTLNTKQETLTNMDSAPDNSAAEYVLEYMNGVLDTKYKKSTKAHIENINARLNDGHTVEELKRVIDFKNAQWANDPKMATYLRPQTLFQAGKFQGYLTAANVKPKSNGHNLSGKVYESGDL